ncbi:hypothetical protein ABZP36_021459 [Zizania latifolia]
MSSTAAEIHARVPLMAEDSAALDVPPLENSPQRESALDEETRALVIPDAGDLPAFPPSAVEANFARYFVVDFLNPGHGSVCVSSSKRNAQHLQENSALCKVCTNDKSFVVRCCVKGSLLEINDRLIKQPDLLYTAKIVFTVLPSVAKSDVHNKEIFELFLL